MAYRKKTLRTMSPTARKVARLCGELDSVSRRLKNLVPDLQRLEFDSKALLSAKGVGRAGDLPGEVGSCELPEWLEEVIEVSEDS